MTENFRRSRFYSWATILLAFSVLLTSGCGGCRDDSKLTAAEKKKAEEEKKKAAEAKKKEAEKPNFETKLAVFLPGDHKKPLETNFTKMGHWVTTNFRVIANKFDSQGELTAYSVGAGRQPVLVPKTNYYSVTSRPVSMPKGEWRNLETNVFIPRRDTRSALIDYAVNRGIGGLAQVNDGATSKIMDAYQYHMVVLTNRREAYRYLPLLDVIKLPNFDDYSLAPNQPFYHVVVTDPKEYPIQLPRESLNWTTIAYLVWDDLNPAQLDEEQQQAMLDWLHFGGQLILSGPDCLDKLGNSFLADYLPAKFDGTKNLTDKEFDAVNTHWSIPVSNQPKLKRTIQVSEKAPLIGVEFAPHKESNFVAKTGDLVVERRIGRGRIVATSFSLDDKPVVLWPSFRGFLNGCLMRRPAREFSKTLDMSHTFKWVNDSTSIYDPLIGSTLRYLSRDLVQQDFGQGTPTSIDESAVRKRKVSTPSGFYNGYEEASVTGGSRDVDDDHWHYGGFQHDDTSGVAGWNDDSGVSAAARDTLKEAAGIVPPSSDFVLKMLAVYLFVLVPLNWFIFRMMGRVEWAWIAAPLIAIAGAFSVAKMASLDIGFVRSNSQVGIVEVYADYPRAHVAQYSALYTSLSTGYDIDLDNHTAQCLPLGAGVSDGFVPKETSQAVTLRRTLTNRLEGLQIQSNTTGLLHTEYMLDIGGVFRIDGQPGTELINNASTLNLTSAGVIRRDKIGQLSYAFIGDLPAGTTSGTLEFIKSGEGVRKPWNDSKALLSNRRRAKNFWDNSFEHTEAARAQQIVFVSQLQQVPEFAARWDDVMSIVLRMKRSFNSENVAEAEITYPEFVSIVSQFDLTKEVNVSRIFDAVIDNLTLAPGEVRLLGVTNQALGNTKFSPASTQTHQRSLVVAHLQMGNFPKIGRDTNCIFDLTGRSDLDWQRELEELDELAEEVGDSAAPKKDADEKDKNQAEDNTDSGPEDEKEDVTE